jgi:hypothetical protein
VLPAANISIMSDACLINVIFSPKEDYGDERKITTHIAGLVILNRSTALAFKHVLSTLHMNVFHILDLDGGVVLFS